MPDVGIMQELCKILDVTINDLFSGEVVDMKNNEKKLEENLLEITRLKEARDKELLFVEVVMGFIISLLMGASILLASLVEMADFLRVIIIIIGVTPFAFGIFYLIRIEQIAGYYECKNCHFKYVPTYKRVLFSNHVNRTRKMRCPNCKKKTWHKKVLSK